MYEYVWRKHHSPFAQARTQGTILAISYPHLIHHEVLSTLPPRTLWNLILLPPRLLPYLDNCNSLQSLILPLPVFAPHSSQALSKIRSQLSKAQPFLSGKSSTSWTWSPKVETIWAPCLPCLSSSPPLMSSLCAVMCCFLGSQGFWPFCPLCPPCPLAQAAILGSNVTFLGSLSLILSQEFPSCIHQFISGL